MSAGAPEQAPDEVAVPGAVRRTSAGGARWLQAGPTPAPTGRVPVVLLHGLTDSSDCWPTVLPRLAVDRTVLAFDARGHGGTPLPDEPFTVSALADDVAEALHGLDLGPVLVVGHSMGGVTAGALAQRHPDLVAGLLLEDPAWRPADDRGAPGWLAEELVRVAGRTAEQIAGVGRTLMPTWSEAEILGWARSETMLDPRLVEVPHDWAEQDWVEALAEVHVPVTLVTADPAVGSVVRPEQVARAAALLGLAPGGLLTHVPAPGAGHNVRREAPEVYLAALDAAVARADAAA